MVKDLVSVVMPVYNDQKHLERAIRCILEQTYQNTELIIVDDGSTDSTREIIEKYSKINKVTHIYKDNGGTGSALNAGFELASGEFGTWVSSDDIQELNMIERLVKFLKNNRDIEYVVGAFHEEKIGLNWRSYAKDATSVFGYRERTPADFINDKSEQRDGFDKTLELCVDDWVELSSTRCHQGVSHMFTMRLKNKCGKYDEIPGEDYIMSVKMGMNTRVGYIGEKLGTHCYHQNSLTAKNEFCVADANNKVKKEITTKAKKWKWFLNKIPRIAHFYWGSPKMSYMRYMTLLSFKKMNPNWSVILYVPKKKTYSTWVDDHHKSDNLDYHPELDYFNKIQEDIAVKVVEVDFEKVLKDAPEAHRSDFLRWHLLHDRGGLWCDMDILFFKPINELYFNTPQYENINTVVCCDPRHVDLWSIGFMMSGKGNKFFRQLSKKTLELIKKTKKEERVYQAFGSPMIKSMFLNSKDISRKFIECSVENLNYSAVYFYDFKNLDKVYKEKNFKNMPKDAVGLHWYGGHPDSQEMNNRLNHKTWKKEENTFTEVLKYLEEVDGVI